MAQNIINSPWERTRGPWLCLMITLLLFTPLRLFSFVSTFLTSLIKITLLLKLSTGKRKAEDMVRGQGPYGPALFQWGTHINYGILLHEDLSHFPHILTYWIICLGFPGGASGKEPACPCRRHKRSGIDPGLGRSGGRHGNLLQHSCLENLMDRGAWQAVVHRIAQGWTWLK